MPRGLSASPNVAVDGLLAVSHSASGRRFLPSGVKVKVSPQPGGNVVTALTTQLARLKQTHREEVAALRRALEAAHGENLALRREMTHRGWESPGA